MIHFPGSSSGRNRSRPTGIVWKSRFQENPLSAARSAAGFFSFRKTGNILKFHNRAVIQNHPAGKKSAELPPGHGIKKHPVPFDPFLMGAKGHFQAVVVAGKTPGQEPVGGGDMKSNLIQFMEFSVYKKGVFRSQA
jgi:hypothetical protein